MGDTDHQADLAALEHFVVENDELLALEARIGRFNIFDALGIVNNEIRHSNFLAWLLDPGESHGLGPLFLNAVLMDLLRKTPVKDRLFSPIKLDGGELCGVQVRREWNRIDLLITCEDPDFVIAIENKVYSSEHSNQLARYKKIVGETPELARHTHRQFVYLTRDGDEPSEEAWTIYSYADLHRVLTKVRASSGDQMGDDVRAFLDHYLRMIGSRFMDDKEIDELCQSIFTKHRQAIELIWDRGRPAPLDLNLFQEALNADSRFEVFNVGRSAIEFIPVSWKVLPERDSFEGTGRPWVKWMVGINPSDCYAFVEVGPCHDAALRERIIQRLIELESRYAYNKLSQRKIGGSYTRLKGKTFLRWETELPEPDEIIAAFSRLVDDWYKKFDGLERELLPVFDK